MGRVKDILIDYQDAQRANQKLHKKLNELFLEHPEIGALRDRTEQLTDENEVLRQLIAKQRAAMEAAGIE